MRLAAVALVAATAFLVAAFLGVGSHPEPGSGQPESIVVGTGQAVSPGDIASAVTPTVAPSLPSGPSPAVVSVGRAVSSLPLSDLSSSPATTSGSQALAAPASPATFGLLPSVPGEVILPATGVVTPGGPTTGSQIPVSSPAPPTSTVTLFPSPSPSSEPLLKTILGGLRPSPTPTK